MSKGDIFYGILIVELFYKIQYFFSFMVNPVDANIFYVFSSFLWLIVIGYALTGRVCVFVR